MNKSCMLCMLCANKHKSVAVCLHTPVMKENSVHTKFDSNTGCIPYKVCRSSPVVASHIRTLLSKAPLPLVSLLDSTPPTNQSQP